MNVGYIQAQTLPFRRPSNMTEELQRRIEQAAAALKAAGATEVYLFGSAADDDRFDDCSDVDLAVAGLPPEKFFRAMGAARCILDRTLDLVDLDEPSPFVRRLKEKGQLRRVA
jgi:predicted nucleotidyltransferase